MVGSRDSFSDEQPHDEPNGAYESEEIIFAEETESNQPERSWRVLIVDDEIEVHQVTKLALSDFTFEEKSLTFISAYSAQEAKQLIQTYPDIAIIFLDVVMETETAGLQLVKYIREELNNHIVRIILRTGQPGRAPENVVAVNYGIDDYKTKTELTSQKLSITVVTALRAFSTLIQMLDVTQNLELELTQHRELEAALRLSEMRERKKVYKLEQTLQALQQIQSQMQQPTKPDPLGQRVSEVAHLINVPDDSGTFQTMSMITRLARLVLRITDEHSAKLGISQTKLAVLMYLNDETDLCASPSELAKHCGVSRAAMTGLLDGLEQEGYVERDNHPTDRRALRVKLTLKGQQFLDWLAPQDQYQLSELMSHLNEAEQSKLIELATKVIHLFKET